MRCLSASPCGVAASNNEMPFMEIHASIRHYRKIREASWSGDLRGRRTHLCLTGSWEGLGQSWQGRWCLSNIVKKGCLHLQGRWKGGHHRQKTQPGQGQGGLTQHMWSASQAKANLSHLWVNIQIFKSIFLKRNYCQISQESPKIISLECPGNKKPIKILGVGREKIKKS